MVKTNKTALKKAAVFSSSNSNKQNSTKESSIKNSHISGKSVEKKKAFSFDFLFYCEIYLFEKKNEFFLS